MSGFVLGTIRSIISDIIEWTDRFGDNESYSSSIRVQGPGTLTFGSLPDSVRALNVVTWINPELEAAVLAKHGFDALEKFLDPELGADVLAVRIAELAGVEVDQLDIDVQPNDVQGKDLDTGREVKQLRSLQAQHPGLKVNPFTQGTVRRSKSAGWGVIQENGRVRVFLGRSGWAEAHEQAMSLAPFNADGSFAAIKPVSELVRNSWDDRYKWVKDVKENMDVEADIRKHRSQLKDADEILVGGKVFSNWQVTDYVEGSYMFLTDAPADDGEYGKWPISEKGPQEVRTNAYRVVTISFASNMKNPGQGFLWKSKDTYYAGSVKPKTEEVALLKAADRPIRSAFFAAVGYVIAHYAAFAAGIPAFAALGGWLVVTLPFLAVLAPWLPLIGNIYFFFNVASFAEGIARTRGNPFARAATHDQVRKGKVGIPFFGEEFSQDELEKVSPWLSGDVKYEGESKLIRSLVMAYNESIGELAGNALAPLALALAFVGWLARPIAQFLTPAAPALNNSLLGGIQALGRLPGGVIRITTDLTDWAKDVLRQRGVPEGEIARMSKAQIFAAA